VEGDIVIVQSLKDANVINARTACENHAVR
jgi:hypothetical protein